MLGMHNRKWRARDRHRALYAGCLARNTTVAPDPTGNKNDSLGMVGAYDEISEESAALQSLIIQNTLVCPRLRLPPCPNDRMLCGDG